MAPRTGQAGNAKFQKANQRPRALKRKRQEEDLDALTQKVADLEPKSSSPPESFSELPLSQATADGLDASHFKTLTTIQSRTIPLALKGSDILGAAKTGSGKTLAFIVPVLENLYRKRWTEYVGLERLYSPTRELAIQIFDVLRKVGRNHTFSAGLVIGGKNLQEEKERLGRMNILVATPGRMLQHMDQTAELEMGNLQMLVLDEADRILDMGFQQTIDALVQHLPSDRQTLLFSATQTKKVSDLARLSLKEPEFVSVHEAAESATPASLQQNYIVSALPEKLDTLWSFIRANVKKKILVFFSSGKQVRFVYESFRHLQPGISLLHLHGRQKQTARLDITTKFSNSKYACLFSTDVAARGLDFPAVDWVVQVDAPEDADTYIHRVGRTARFEHEGHAVMFLDPSEEKGMLNALDKKKVSLEKINVRQKKMQNTVRNQLQNMCFKDPELKYLGQKAFVSYVRSVHIQKDKETFNVKNLDLEQFAASLGLPGAPRVKFIKGEDAKARKNAPRALIAALAGGSEDDSDNIDGRKDKTKAVRTKYDRMFERRNQDVFAEHYKNLIEDDTATKDGKSKSIPGEHTGDADSDLDFLSVKRRFEAGDSDLGQQDEATSSDESGEDQTNGSTGKKKTSGKEKTKPRTIQLSTNPSAEALVIDSHRREKLLQSKKKLLKYKGLGTHMTFDSDSDTPQNHRAYRDEATFTGQGKSGVEAEKAEFLERERDRAKQMDIVDKEVAREKRREKKDKRKERERAAVLADEHDSDGGEMGGRIATLVPYDEEENYTASRLDGGDSADERPEPEITQPKSKRQKKWFEDPSSSDDDEVSRQKKKNKKNKKRRDEAEEQPQTLEDLEALASGLLANDS